MMEGMMNELTQTMAQLLSKPFPEDAISWKPQVTTKGRDKQPITRNGQRIAGCTAHITARDVMSRLDEVVGMGNWSDSYRVLPNGKNVECTLTVMGVSKSDVGEPNEGGFADAFKAAYSDALKRAAVKFGIGRHLYEMEMEWLPFDGYRIIETPKAPTPAPAKKYPTITAEELFDAADYSGGIPITDDDFLDAPPGQVNPGKTAQVVKQADTVEDKRGDATPDEQAKRQRPTAASVPSKNGDLPTLGGGKLDVLRKRFHKAGHEKHGDAWEIIRKEICERYGVESSNDLDVKQAKEIIQELEG